MKEDDGVKVAGLPYIQVFRAFREVQEACFGMELKPDFEKLQLSAIVVLYCLNVGLKLFYFYFIWSVPRPVIK